MNRCNPENIGNKLALETMQASSPEDLLRTWLPEGFLKIKFWNPGHILGNLKYPPFPVILEMQVAGGRLLLL